MFQDEYFFIWISLLNFFSTIFLYYLIVCYIQFVKIYVERKNNLLFYSIFFFEYAVVFIFICFNTYCLINRNEIFENLNLRMTILLDNFGNNIFFCLFIIYSYICF